MIKFGFLVLVFGISFAFSNGNLINEDPDEFIRQHLNPVTKTQIEFLIATSFLKRIEYLKEINNDVYDNVLFPELNATYPIQDTYLYVPEGGPWGGIIEGEINFCDSTLYGMDTVVDKVDLDLRELFLGKVGLNYSIHSGEVALSGQTSLGIRILLGLLRVLGFGEYNIGVNGGFLELMLEINANLLANNFTILEFGLDIGFDNTTFYCEEGILNEVEINFEELNYEIKDTYDAFWPIIKRLIDDGVRDILNALFKDCSLTDLLDQNFTCIGTILTDEMIETQIEALLSPVHTKQDADCSNRITYRTVPPKPTTQQPEIPGTSEGVGLVSTTFSLLLTVVILNYFLSHNN